MFDGIDTVDYRTLDRWTDAAAHVHLARGVKPGDRVAIVGDNALEWVFAGIGALKAGAVVVPFNNRFTAHELGYLVDDARPRIVLTDAAPGADGGSAGEPSGSPDGADGIHRSAHG